VGQAGPRLADRKTESNAASAIADRGSVERSPARNARSAGSARRMPRWAAASVSGVAARLQMASKHWLSASSPVLSVSSHGSVSCRSGSTIAVAGNIRGVPAEALRRASVSQIVAVGVTSAPVPAVVGMATTGIGSRPASAAAWPSRSRNEMSAPASTTESTLAVSRALPPPAAITVSKRSPRQRAII
jgi:hypothetical protein